MNISDIEKDLVLEAVQDKRQRLLVQIRVVDSLIEKLSSACVAPEIKKQPTKPLAAKSTKSNMPRGNGEKSKYKGVYKDKKGGGWQASPQSGGKMKYIGRFKTEEEAASAVAKFLKCEPEDLLKSNQKKDSATPPSRQKSAGLKISTTNLRESNIDPKDLEWINAE